MERVRRRRLPYNFQRLMDCCRCTKVTSDIRYVMSSPVLEEGEEGEEERARGKERGRSSWQQPRDWLFLHSGAFVAFVTCLSSCTLACQLSSGPYELYESNKPMIEAQLNLSDSN